MCMPNDGDQGHTNVEPQNITTSVADQASYNSSFSLTDSKHSCAFAGELA